MNRIKVLFFGFVIMSVFISCSTGTGSPTVNASGMGEVSENSNGGSSSSGNSSTSENLISIVLTPIETRSNANLTINTSITSANGLKKIVYKKGSSEDSSLLLIDTDAIDITDSVKVNRQFVISAINEEQGNGLYSMAVADEADNKAIIHFSVTQFDFTAPSLISNVIFAYENNKVTFSWSNPTENDFDHVEIKYSYNDGNSESAIGNPVSVAGHQYVFDVKQGLESSAKTYTYYLRSVDILGNISNSVQKTVSVYEYAFHETVEYLSAGTDGTGGTTATYVLFGDWPQTIKSDSVEIIETQTMSIGGFTYYKGSDGDWYVKCKENAYRTQHIDPIYSDGTAVSEISVNSEKYFRVQPIKWRVFTTKTSKTVLLAENILLADIPYYGKSDGSSSSRKNGVKSSHYKYSNIRAYLNGTKNQYIIDYDDMWNYSDNVYNYSWENKGFLQSAFTNNAQAIIAKTDVDNSYETCYPYGFGDKTKYYYHSEDHTQDWIFLLSVQEISNSSTLSWYSDFAPVVTDYAKANYAYTYRINQPERDIGSFMLRSQDGTGYNYCNQNKSVFSKIVTDRSNGIVPVITLRE